jgi:hypothetical protein
MKHEHPIIAAIYDRMRQSEERGFFGSLRDEIVGLAEGSVLEQTGFAVREVRRISIGMLLDRPIVAGIAGMA